MAPALLVAVVLTQAWPPLAVDAAAVPGTKAWVVIVGPTVQVLDEGLRPVHLDAELRACLQGPPGELLPLVGDRGVVVSSLDATCVVRAAGVEPLEALKLEAPWREYTWPHQTPASQAVVAKVRAGGLVRKLEQKLWQEALDRAAAGEQPVEVPGCGCALVAREVGVAVLVDGGVDAPATLRLRGALGPVEVPTRFELEPADGGVTLRHDGNTYAGTCPAGDEYSDEVVIRWSARTRSLVTPRLPWHERDTRSFSHRQRPLVNGLRVPADGGEVFDIPESPLTLVVSDGAMVVLRDGGVDVENSRAVQQLVRASCLDWPSFTVDGPALRSFEDGSSFMGRCGGEVVGCDVSLRYDAAQARVVRESRAAHCAAAATQTSSSPEEQARLCAATVTEDGQAELALADLLLAAGRGPEALAHVELALAKGLPAPARARARNLLAAPASPR